MKTSDVNHDMLFFAAFMFRLNHLEQRIEPRDHIMLEVQCGKHTFLICEEGEGHLYIGTEHWPFSTGHIYPVSPGEAYQLEHRGSKHLKYKVMTYDVFQAGSGNPEQYTRPLFQNRTRLNDTAAVPLHGEIKEIYASRSYKNDAEYSHLNTLFQRWMELIITRYCE
ncbi:hypothetical protein GCM10008014_02080 [Paenibacillus silvae]|uniref:AraC-type arabinose-binding/dimerisation domain-containing protein n=1 Tax=Paenibacillus silvae TaxID=1325358 RepID=A0ABQ1YXL1_9BACL|nr:hypothetical protein [Paenibacillus silvae]GGH42088.1 hypothetical protein GCM10008014_02080 [Paenibacillus silvae]